MWHISWWGLLVQGQESGASTLGFRNWGAPCLTGQVLGLLVLINDAGAPRPSRAVRETEPRARLCVSLVSPRRNIWHSPFYTTG